MSIRTAASRFTIRVWCYLALVLPASAALGHPASTSAVYLDVNDGSIGMEVQMPVDQLRMAKEELFVSPPAPREGVKRAQLIDYLRKHIDIRTPSGAGYVVAVGDTVIRDIDSVPYLMVNLTFTPPGNRAVNRFELHYNAILHRVINHRVYVSLRSDFKSAVFSGEPQLLEVIRYRHEQLMLDRSTGSLWSGFAAMLVNGASHIVAGVDHLLFLLCLLLPAPLLARSGHWQVPAGLNASLVAVVKIVTAFTVGHSITLVLAALDIARAPAKPVETLVAVSVLVSALHALRPVFGRQAAVLAAGFGLVHGLAFANELVTSGFSTDAVVLSLLGFNLGIELVQLLIVAALVPCLWAISLTRIYTPLRVGGALFAATAALGWIVARTWSGASPVGNWIDTAAGYGLWIYAALAMVAGISLMLGWQRSDHRNTR